MIRLNKALADAGVCSRRKADELISSGIVCVNQQVVTALGTKVDMDTDSITVAGKPLVHSTTTDEKRYILLHKPIEVVSTAYDPEGRPTVLDCLKEQEKDVRLYPVGRLDYFSEGLLLLTNDGELTHRLTHPSYELPKVYEVLVREKVTQNMLSIMQKGMVLAEGEHLAPVEAHIIEKIEQKHDDPETNNNNTHTTLVLVLRQGLNRQVRRMCRDLHLTVLHLKRVGLGPLQLGELTNGEYRHLTQKEVQSLYKAVNL